MLYLRLSWGTLFESQDDHL